ncbi:MAG: ATP-binding protein [Acidimicrobiia bacterium]
MTTRIAAFVFSDLVGSSALRSRLGDDAVDPLRRAVHAVLQDAVAAHHGEEVKNLGDGIMAAFDSAAQAVSSGIAMQQGVARLAAAQPGIGLELRVGVSAGEATVEQDDWFGTPVVEAARLCARAESGQVLVSEVVQTLVAARRRHRFRSVGKLALKGLAMPLAAYAVDWEPAVDVQPVGPAAEVTAPPAPDARLVVSLPPRLRSAPPFGFFGRSTEQAALRSAWKEAAADRCQVVLVSGEPGIGKTALSAVLARTVHAEGAVVLYGRCDKDLGLPYQPFVEALRGLVLEATPQPGLRAWARVHGAALTPVLPELAERFPEVAVSRAADPEAERYRLFKAVSSLLAAVSASQPLLLVLDDLHWAAKPTLMLLEYVASAVEPMPVLLLGTFRETDISRAHPLAELLADLRRQPWVSRMALQGLGDDEVMALVEHASGGPLDEPGVALAHAVHRETDGNPFFVAELLRHLAESGAVVREGPQWVLGGTLEAVGLPVSVREVIGQRLQRLREETRSLLSLAAVIGRDLDLDLLGRVSELPEGRLLDALDEATGAALIHEVAGRPDRFTFSHSLIQHVLYDELSGVRRVRAHQRVAAALEELCGDDPGERVAELAHHWVAATRPIDVRQTISYARQAGDRALAQLAPEEAVAWYTQALELQDTQTRNDERRADLLLDLGEAQRRAGQSAFRETLLEAAAMARRLGDTDRLVRAALANNRGIHSASGYSDAERVAVLQAAVDALGGRDSPERARLLATLTVELTYSGEWERRRALADEALAVARRVGDDATLARVLNLRHSALQVPEAVGELMDNSAENLVITARLGDAHERFWALQCRFWTIGAAGRMEEAEERLAELERLVDALGQPALGWYARFHRSWCELLAGRVAESERFALEALQLGNDSGQPDAIAVFVAQLAMVRRDQGRLDELVEPVAQQVADNPGIPGFRALLALCYCELDRLDEARSVFAVDAAGGFSGIPYDPVWSSAMTMLAEVCALLDDAESAVVLTDKLRPYAGVLAHNGCTTFGAVDRYLGMLAATQGRFSEAESHFSAAASIHTRIGAPIWLARTQVEWARMLFRRNGPGDSERARELLASALLTGRELDLGYIVRQAGTLLGP